MSVFFFSFLKHFLEFRFPVIVDFAVSMLSLFRNITYNGNWFLGKPDSALKSHVLASTTSGPESYRVLKSKERHQNYLLEQKNNRVLRNVDPIVYLSNTNFISEYEKFVSRLLYSDIQQIIDVSVQNVVEQYYLNFILLPILDNQEQKGYRCTVRFFFYKVSNNYLFANLRGQRLCSDHIL